jgi:hypothetical protein
MEEDMSEGLTCGILTLVAFFLWLGAGILRTYLQWHAGLKIREMLYKERIAALNKNVALPVDSPSITAAVGWTSIGTNRFVNATATRILSLVGVVLLSLGIGVLLALLKSGVSEWVKMWSLGFVPASVGAGLLIYSLFVKTWRKT